MWLLSTSVTAVRQEFQRVVVDRQTLTDVEVRSGVNSNPTLTERSRGIKFTCWCGAGLSKEASGLVLEILHKASLSIDIPQGITEMEYRLISILRGVQ